MDNEVFLGNTQMRLIPFSDIICIVLPITVFQCLLNLKLKNSSEYLQLSVLRYTNMHIHLGYFLFQLLYGLSCLKYWLRVRYTTTPLIYFCLHLL